MVTMYIVSLYIPFIQISFRFDVMTMHDDDELFWDMNHSPIAYDFLVNPFEIVKRGLSKIAVVLQKKDGTKVQN